MPGNAMLVHVGYSESYENKQQDECQSAYFGHSTLSIFTAVSTFYLTVNSYTRDCNHFIDQRLLTDRSTHVYI